MYNSEFPCVIDCFPIIQIFLRNQHLYTVEQNDADKLVARAARNIEQLLRKRSAALEVRLASVRETNCQFASLCRC